MKLSPLILSMAAAATVGVSADRLGAVSPRTSRASSALAIDRTTPITAMPHRHLKEEEGAAGSGLCGQCKKDDDCLPNYECVTATASGCFNFDVSGVVEMYCKPRPTAAPTVMVTEAPAITPGPTNATVALTNAPTAATAETAAPTAATAATVAPTAVTTSSPTVVIPAATTAPTAVATTTAPTAAATTTAPTATSSALTTINTTTTTATTPSPTPVPNVGSIRFIGGDPDIMLRVCEGDCDDDDDCEGNLVCMQRSGNEPIPGCGGDPREYADYCVPPAAGRSSVVAAAVDTPSSGAVGISGIASIIASGVAVVGTAILSIL